MWFISSVIIFFLKMRLKNVQVQFLQCILQIFLQPYSRVLLILSELWSRLSLINRNQKLQTQSSWLFCGPQNAILTLTGLDPGLELNQNTNQVFVSGVVTYRVVLLDLLNTTSETRAEELTAYQSLRVAQRDLFNLNTNVRSLREARWGEAKLWNSLRLFFAHVFFFFFFFFLWHYLSGAGESRADWN